MNTELLAKIYKAKDARRKHLVHLPLDKKIEIIEQLRDMGIALRAARREFAKNFVKSDVVRTCGVQIPAQNPPAFS